MCQLSKMTDSLLPIECHVYKRNFELSLIALGYLNISLHESCWLGRSNSCLYDMLLKRLYNKCLFDF